MKRSDFEFSYPLRVRYAEVDAQAIVFNAHYLTYFDVGITEYFRTAGHAYGDFAEQRSIDFHVIRTVIDYKSPARFDEEIQICVRGEYKGPKIFWTLGIFKAEKLVCSGEVVYITMDTENEKIRKVDPDLAAEIGIIKREK